MLSDASQSAPTKRTLPPSPSINLIGQGVRTTVIGRCHPQPQRTLSSSSLLLGSKLASSSQGTSLVGATVCKSKSEYDCDVVSVTKRVLPQSPSSKLYIDHQHYGTKTSSPELLDHLIHGGPSTRLKLKPELNKPKNKPPPIPTEPEPIIIHVPITAPKATATTLSRATSPPPPAYLSSLPPEEVEGRGGAETSVQIEADPQHRLKLPHHLKAYAQNGRLQRARHPLEENIFSSLLLTMLAVGLALLVGIPMLGITGALLLTALCFRYSVFLLYGTYAYFRFLCTLSGVPGEALQSSRFPRPPQILPRDRLAFANDVRWLGGNGKRGPGCCQPILHTVLVFDGKLDLGSLRNLILSRVIHQETPEGELAYPRLMQKIIPFPAGWRWETDYGFDVKNHIYSDELDGAALDVQRYLSALLNKGLSLRRPLWEIRVVANYGEKKDTLAILRVHQCLADGMTLVRILSHALADHAQMHIPQRPHFAGMSFGFNVLRSLIVGPLTFFMWMVTTWKDKNLFNFPLSRAGRDKSCGWPCFKRTRGSGGECSKGKVVGVKNKGNKNKRRKKTGFGLWNVTWSAPISVAKVARVKQIMRSSLNDVLLAAVAGSVRVYLQKMGIPCPGDVKVVIPVDLRNDITSPKSSTKLGCKVATVVTTIPSGIEGAIPRLWATRHRLDELKASADPVVAYGATTVLMNILPHFLAVTLLDGVTDKASLQFSNLPGPSHTLVVGGFALKGIYPIYPPRGRLRVAISAFSYADQVHLSVVSHKSLVNAGQELLQGITHQIEQLSKQLCHRRVPGESRRSARLASLALQNNPEISKPPTRQIHMQLQVVQEELQELSHRLEPVNPPLVEEVDEEEEEEAEEAPKEPHSSEESIAPNAVLRTRLATLKSEYSELIGELRRRSSIVEGCPMSFEDEECEDDFRKPRKRALSVVSMSRRSSIFSASRSMTTPESSQVCYSSEDEEEMPSSPAQHIRMYGHSQGHGHGHGHQGHQGQQQQQQQPQPGPSSSMRQHSSPMKTTAV